MLVAALAGLATDAAAQVGDPHALFESKCRGCHTEHGADLARLKFAVVKDKLQVARTGVAVEQLLRKHHGVKLSAAEGATLDRLFRNGLRWGGVFQHRCAKCHDNAMTLARSRLTIVDGRIKGLTSGADAQSFLADGHGAATPGEVATLLDMFKYQLESAPKP